MPKIELDQNTDEWFEFRKSKIGASEIPIILGISPYSTPLKLWKRKLGFEGEQKMNSAMKFGHENESRVRERMQIKYGLRIDPAMYVHDEIEWASASLDGIDENNVIYEIKSCCSEDHECARSGKVPKKYYPQVTWQMFVTGADHCRYVSSRNDEDIVVDVLFDEQFAIECLEKASEFYECMISYSAPALTDKDHLIIEDSEFGMCALEWQNAKEVYDRAKKQLDFYKNRMIEFTDDSNCEGYGVRLTRVNQSGSVDMDKLCDEYNINKVDLDKLRKPQVGFWKISIVKS